MSNRIEIVPSGGQFIVRITENGVTEERIFSLESHAISWASGQTIRLVNSSDDVTDSLRQAFAAANEPERSV